AGVVDDAAAPPTTGAGLLEQKRPERPLSATAPAGGNLRAWPGPAALARRAGLIAGHLEFLLDAAIRLQQRDLEGDLQAGPGPRPPAPAAAPAEHVERLAQHVHQVFAAAEWEAAGLAALEAGVSVSVVNFAFFAIAEDGIGLDDGLEMDLGFWV